MRRRDFIRLIAYSTAAWPIVARAQAGKLPTIGFLGAGTPSSASQRVVAFEKRLKELGWIPGHNIAIEYRWAEGRFERSTQIIGELIHLNVNIIVTHGTENVVAAKQATSTIPIVFAIASDPVGNALVASLSRPGSNVTGLSIQAPDLAGKRLELLRETVPGLRRLAAMAAAANPSNMSEVGELQTAARKFGIEITPVQIRRPEEISVAFDSFKGRINAIYVCADALFNTNRASMNSLALAGRIPTMYDNREFVEAGGLMSYGPNILDLFRRSAEFVDKILRGTKPANIPVEQPTKFDLVINLKTAKALDLTVSPTMLVRANEVIE